MSDRKQRIREHLVRRHSETWPILQALSPDQLDAPVYDHGEDQGWTARELVAHLADAEAGLLAQAKRLSIGKQPLPPDFDIDRWNRSAVRKRKDTSLEEHLAEIESAFLAALDFLEQVEERALDNEGVRPGPERVTVESLLKRIANHRAEHVEDLRRALGAD